MDTPIRAGEVYTRAQFLKRLAIGDFTFRRMKREGLQIIKLGKHVLIDGSDAIEFFNRRKRQSAAAPTSTN